MNKINAYIAAAASAGCPRDQIENFIKAGYVALPEVLKFHAAAREADKGEIREIMLDGTRGAAKSHAIIAQVCLDDCVRFPGLKFLFLRQTKRAATESFNDLVKRVLQNVPHELTSKHILFANGSQVTIGGYRNERDIDHYVGVEYDGTVIEEATQISGQRYEKLLGSIRTSKQGWSPRVYISTNPGGIGHSFYRERFVIPEVTGSETSTRRFFLSYRNNPFIDAGYKTYLETLTGDIAAFWREGSWDTFSGQAFRFTEKHIVPPFDIPQEWLRWRAVDWGYNAPMCCLWFAKEPDTGRLFVYRELYRSGLTDRQQARLIRDMTPHDEEIAYTFADPSMWNSKNSGDTVTSSADEYRFCGVFLKKADNSRLSGKRKVDRLLANLPDGKPGLQIFPVCKNLIRTLPTLVYDQVNTEDIDSEGEDHAYDALRYGLTNVRENAKIITRSTWVSPYEKVSVL